MIDDVMQEVYSHRKCIICDCLGNEFIVPVHSLKIVAPGRQLPAPMFPMCSSHADEFIYDYGKEYRTKCFEIFHSMIKELKDKENKLRNDE